MKKTHAVSLIALVLCVGILHISLSGDESFNHLTQKQIEQRISLELKEIERASLSSKEKAEFLTKLGERALIPSGFPFSLKLFQNALEHDRTHERANFYTALLAPLMQFEGVLARIKFIPEPSLHSLHHWIKQESQNVNAKDRLLINGLHGFLLRKNDLPPFYGPLITSQFPFVI